MEKQRQHFHSDQKESLFGALGPAGDGRTQTPQPRARSPQYAQWTAGGSTCSAHLLAAPEKKKRVLWCCGVSAGLGRMAAVFLVTLFEYSPLFYIAVVSLCFVVTAVIVVGW